VSQKHVIVICGVSAAVVLAGILAVWLGHAEKEPPSVPAGGTADRPPEASRVAIPVDPDSDKDGLPDEWERKYFGDLKQQAKRRKRGHYWFWG